MAAWITLRMARRIDSHLPAFTRSGCVHLAPLDSRAPALDLRPSVHLAMLDSPSTRKAHPHGYAHPGRTLPSGSIPAGSIAIGSSRP